MKTPVEILQGAKTALQEHGWARKNFVDPVTGGLCMHGALACSTGLYQEILKSEDDGVYFPRINDAGD
ncbi:MAG: DUF6197 family protein, partial [bacterium]